MKIFYSPLRYPGGKSRLAKFIALVCEKNQISNSNGHYVEPYAGGASVALYLLLNGYVSKISINDIDRSIYAFWYVALNQTEKLVEKIKDTKIDIKTWKTCREVQRNKGTAPLFDLGFSTLFLNRVNISGIIGGGVIGGLKQKGKYKIDCRFNKQEIIRRIEAIASFKDKISMSNLDALDLVKKIEKKSTKQSTIFYFDPPYYLKGESLYLNHYDYSDHQEVGRTIQQIKNFHWIVSYDAVAEVKRLYRGYKKIEYPLLHTARTPRLGEEILFFSRNLIIPKVSNPVKV
jgi:DNA adenine methylase